MDAANRIQQALLEAILLQVKSEPIDISGVAGPVTVERSFGRRAIVRVAGVEIPRDRRGFSLPATSGDPVKAELKHPGDPLPSLEVAGTVYQFGPHNPRWVWVLAWLPMLWVTVGWVGVITAALGWMANYVMINGTLWRPATKAAVAGAVGLATIPLAAAFGTSLHDWYRDVSGQGPLSPLSVTEGSCVNVGVVSALEVEIDGTADCSKAHDGEVVVVTTLGAPSASNLRSQGPTAFCQEAGQIRISSPVDPKVSYRIRVATTGMDARQPKSGDSIACVVERQDGRKITGPFSCADLGATQDPRCSSDFLDNS